MSDCIDRKAVLNLMLQNHRTLNLLDVVMFSPLYQDVKNLPSIEPERPHGEWVDVKVGKLFRSNDFKCSRCGNILNFDGVNCGRGDANYCPNCGADMRGRK